MTVSTHMERASRVAGKLRIPNPFMGPGEIACAAWPAAVGEKIARHTRAAKLVRNTLVVEVEDVLWQRNLYSLHGQVVGNLARHLGPGIVENIELRIVPPRLGPQRAERSTAATDEAERIPDPGMRRVYKASRRKALA